MNNTPLKYSDPVRLHDLPDGCKYTAPEILAWCSKYSIVPYISLTGSGLVTFEANLGTVRDPENGGYRKIRKTFNPKKYGGLKPAFEAAKEFCVNYKGASENEKVDMLSIPMRLRPQIIWLLEECEKQQTNFMTVAQAGFAAIAATRVKAEITFAEAAAKCIESKRDISEAYKKDLRFFFNHAGRTFGEQKLNEITSEDIEDWLEEEDFSPVTWNNKLRLFRLLWNFGLEKRNGWVTENVIEELKERQVKDEEVTALTLDQAKGVLRTAHFSIPRLVPYLAVGMFCGFRRDEAKRADWSDIDWETSSIMVRVSKSRTANSRYVHLEPAAVSWLKPLAQAAGPLHPFPYARREELKTLREMTFDFDGNIFRHSFGTYHYHAFSNPQKTIVEMGHTTAQMLFKHYRRPVPQTTAQEYWKLTRDAVLG
jgi:integrase